MKINIEIPSLPFIHLHLPFASVITKFIIEIIITHPKNQNILYKFVTKSTNQEHKIAYLQPNKGYH